MYYSSILYISPVIEGFAFQNHNIQILKPFIRAHFYLIFISAVAFLNGLNKIHLEIRVCYGWSILCTRTSLLLLVEEQQSGQQRRRLVEAVGGGSCCGGRTAPRGNPLPGVATRPFRSRRICASGCAAVPASTALPASNSPLLLYAYSRLVSLLFAADGYFVVKHFEII